jgi:predicted PurR-regulated permease PerM
MAQMNGPKAGTAWSETTKRTVVIAAVLVGVLILYISQSVIPYIIVAVVLAFLLDPIVEFFTRLHLPRGLAVLLVYVLFLIIVMLSPLIFVPAVLDAVRSLSSININLVDVLEKTTTWLREALESVRYVGLWKFQLDMSPLVNPAVGMLSGVVPAEMIPSPGQIFSSIPPAFELAKGVASTVVGTLVWTAFAFLFTLIYAIYVSLDLPKFGDAFMDFVPPPYRPECAELAARIGHVWGAYFRGQLILCISTGIIIAVGDAMLGLPGALALGLVGALLTLLPNVGPILSAVPAVLVALLQGSSVLPVSNGVFTLIVIGFYFVSQVIQNNIVVPRLMGQAVDVHPVVIMAGVIVGAGVGGLLGALMAVPIIATGRILAQYAYNKILDYPPFPDKVPAPPLPGADAHPVPSAEPAQRRAAPALRAPAGDREGEGQSKPGLSENL